MKVGPQKAEKISVALLVAEESREPLPKIDIGRVDHAELVRLFERAGYSIPKVAEATGINKNTLERWKNEHARGKPVEDPGHHGLDKLIELAYRVLKLKRADLPLAERRRVPRL